MFDMRNLKKLGTIGKLAPEAMSSFQAFEKALRQPIALFVLLPSLWLLF
jgi:hypothetical protein